jgi:hypothetical protein
MAISAADMPQALAEVIKHLALPISLNFVGIQAIEKLRVDL